MPDYTRYYILGAFLLGVAATTAYQDRTAKQDPSDEATEKLFKQQRKLLSEFARISDLVVLKKSLVEFESSLRTGAGEIKEGIEGCIGNTPLIKIKSLSEYTGCEILVKAEVELRSPSRPYLH